MSRKRRYIYIAVLGILGFTLLALCIVTADRPESSILFNNDIPSYESLITPSEHPLHIAYEAQAIPLMEAGIAKSYRTDFISTVIIAVDRDRVKDDITSWGCLRNGDYDVYFDYKRKLSHIGFGYTILSMAAGLDYEDSGYSNVMHLLRHLHKEGRLVPEDPFEAPVAIMFDYQAAQRIKSGQNVEIIVPGDGTLSFPAGIMSTDSEKLPDVNPEDLLAAGFRLPNGECDHLIYPDADEYSAAQNAVMTPETAMQTISSNASFQRQVLGERRFSPANGVENTISYFVFIIIIVLWSGMLFMRISDKELQQKLLVMSALLLFWMLVRIIRLQVPDGVINRLSWYLYYIPLLFLPSYLFWIGQILSKSAQKPFPCLLRKIIFLTSTILVLLVLTNDYHQMAFCFYRATQGNYYDLYYSYGWVYYLVFAFSFFLIIAFVFTAVRKKAESTVKQAGFLILLLTVSITYFGGYSIGIPVFRKSEFSIVYGVISLLFLEICFRNRLIPNNIRLGELLHNAPIDMHILSDAMQIEYKTAYSEVLPSEIIEQIRYMGPEKNMPLGLNHPHIESILYGVHRINGGYSIFAQYLDSVIKLRSALSDQNKKIKSQNSILTRTHKIRSEIARLKTQQELFTRIEGVLKERVNRINTILPLLPVNNTKESRGLLQKQLAIIKILVNYCKRRSNLTLLEANNEYCETASIALWLREAIWEANTAGIDGVVTEAGNAKIHSSPASLFYDCFENILESTLKYSSAILLTNLLVTEDSVILRIAVETIPAADPLHFRPEQVLYHTQDYMAASYEVRELDNALKIQISIPKEGQGNGCIVRTCT